MLSFAVAYISSVILSSVIAIGSRHFFSHLSFHGLFNLEKSFLILVSLTDNSKNSPILLGGGMNCYLRSGSL